MHLIFSKPSEFDAKISLPKDLQINHLSIWKDLFNASEDSLVGEWGKSGYELGKAARKVIGNEVSLKQIEVADSLY